MRPLRPAALLLLPLLGLLPAVGAAQPRPLAAERQTELADPRDAAYDGEGLVGRPADQPRYILRDGFGTPSVEVDASRRVSRRLPSRVAPVGLDTVVDLEDVVTRLRNRVEARVRGPGGTLLAGLGGQGGQSGLSQVDEVELERRFAELMVELQLLEDVGRDPQEKAGVVLREQIRRWFAQFLAASDRREIDVYIRGIHNRWPDTIRATREQCPAGECIHLPTYTSPKPFHFMSTLADKTAQLLPFIERQSKIDLPELIEMAREDGTRIRSIVCESGCGFELQRNRELLLEYARDNPEVRLPVLLVNSTGIGGGEVARQFEAAGYPVENVSEFGPVPLIVGAAGSSVGIPRIAGPARNLLGLPVQVGLAVGSSVVRLLTFRGPLGPHGIGDHSADIQSTLEKYTDSSLFPPTAASLDQLWPDVRRRQTGRERQCGSEPCADAADRVSFGGGAGPPPPPPPLGASVQSAQRTVEQLERETAGQIAALRGGLDRLDSDDGRRLTATQWADERERLTSETRTAANNFIESSVRPSEEAEAIEARLRSVLAAHVPERDDLPTARTADLRLGRSLVVVYTVVRPPHFDSGLISGFKEDAGRFRLQATAGADFDGYTMSTLDVPSPFKDELWLLAKGRVPTSNAARTRFRLYGFDGEAFRTIWSPDDMLGAAVREPSRSPGSSWRPCRSGRPIRRSKRHDPAILAGRGAARADRNLHRRAQGGERPGTVSVGTGR